MRQKSSLMLHEDIKAFYTAQLNLLATPCWYLIHNKAATECVCINMQ